MNLLNQNVKIKIFRLMEFLLLSITLVLSGPILATEKIFERKVLVYALNHLVSEVLF